MCYDFIICKEEGFKMWDFKLFWFYDYYGVKSGLRFERLIVLI